MFVFAFLFFFFFQAEDGIRDGTVTGVQTCALPILHGRTSNLIDSILIRAADRAHVAVPMMKMRGGRVEQIEGGYVHSLQPGLYEWVISLDFRAMYPSLIIEYNICFKTVSPIGTIERPTGSVFLSADVKKGLLT